MISIVDYDAGNIKSVINAFRHIGQKVNVLERPDDINKAAKLVLPGVGSSKEAMGMLRKKDMTGCLMKAIRKGVPFLGICLGMQLLFQGSEENGGAEGLGILQGQVKKFSDTGKLKVPQIGWNTVEQTERGRKLFKGIPDGSYFYFVHSYFCPIGSGDNVSGITEYGQRYASAICFDNVFAVQFHPERSQENGLKMLENFSRL